MKLDQVHEDSFRAIQRNSYQENEKMKTQFITKLFKTLQLKNDSKTQKDGDIKALCNNLMKEMLWDLPSNTIDMYCLKKHIKGIPEID